MSELVGHGARTNVLAEERIAELLGEGLRPLALAGRRVLVVIPDNSRSAPIPLFFRLLNEQLIGTVAALDYLIALGTHPPLDESAVARRIGVSTDERRRRFPSVNIFNHAWRDPASLRRVGVIAANEVSQLTNGLLRESIPVTMNRLVAEYDHLLVCGPVFPHEVAGFSGGAKYLFPGISGAEIIDATHWLGALVTNYDTIGVKDTPVRRVIHRAARFVSTPVTCIALVPKCSELHGMWVGDLEAAWSAAADLSEEIDVITLDRPVRRVLSMPSPMYEDLWTAAKAMYKTEAAIADGGEVVIYAPGLQAVSVTHGRQIAEVGYHVLDYFVKQPQRFAAISGAIKAHSTHVKGKGSYDAAVGRETPRIDVVLATGIPEDVCRRINLGYRDPASIDVADWERDPDALVVRNAGELLYRSRRN